ncbi:hypothetical protein CF510_25524 [Pseudomonas aeruginosa PADK2_CF510]|nr:hypothetical protein CF510_25524 [Pseudomonas aeruginosa PADK2_CF510]
MRNFLVTCQIKPHHFIRFTEVLIRLQKCRQTNRAVIAARHREDQAETHAEEVRRGSGRFYEAFQGLCG